MITNPDETMIISSLGWVDKGNLWLLNTRSDDIKKIALSDADCLSLHYEGGDFFQLSTITMEKRLEYQLTLLKIQIYLYQKYILRMVLHILKVTMKSGIKYPKHKFPQRTHGQQYVTPL